MKPTNRKIWIVVASAIVIALVALGVRLYAAERLPIDDDETTYLIASLNYTNYIRAGEYKWLAWNTTNYEHPSLNKIIFGVALLPDPPLAKLQQSDFIDNQPILEAQGVQYGLTDRRVSAAFGSLAVLILALINPLAGAFMAINTLSIKYTSEVYLEALPILTSLISVLAYSMYFKNATGPKPDPKKVNAWLLLSALGLGLTAASKYMYCIAGLAIILHWLIAIVRKQLPARHLLYILVWGLLAFGLFFAFDPYLWPHPVTRLLDSLKYHLRFSNSAWVKKHNYPVWQPLHWLFNPFVSYKTQSNNAFLLHLDPLMFVLAVLGLPRTFKRSPIFFVWLCVGLAFLFIWSTKWAQYPLVIIVPYCISAAYGLTSIYDLIRKRLLPRKAPPTAA